MIVDCMYIQYFCVRILASAFVVSVYGILGVIQNSICRLLRHIRAMCTRNGILATRCHGNQKENGNEKPPPTSLRTWERAQGFVLLRRQSALLLPLNDLVVNDHGLFAILFAEDGHLLVVAGLASQAIICCRDVC